MSEQKNNLGVGSRVKHPEHGAGVVIGIHQVAYEVSFIDTGIKMVGKNYEGWEIIEKIENPQKVSFNELEKSLVKVLRSFSDISEIIELGDKWKDGTIIFKPYDDDLKPKELPIDVFFKKIVMVRDRLRVMEQRINSSNLSDEEKVNLQQYITRIYGSLTTFNILFKNKDDHFVGERGK
nr:hypothetical protein [Saprospiraceae bacterium]